MNIKNCNCNPYIDTSCNTNIIPINNRKLWSDYDNNVLLKFINKNKIINDDKILNIANSLQRTNGAIKTRIFNNFIIKEFDIINNDNDKLYNKYLFLNKNDIEKFILNKLTKKKQILFKLNKLNNIIENTNNNDKENIINIINNIKQTI